MVMGGLIGQARDMTGGSRDWYLRMGGSDQILDAYRASVMQMAGMAVAIYAVQVLLRLRAEEADGPLEPVLATAVSRFRWVASHAIATLAGATALLLLYAVGLGLAAGRVLGDPAAQVRAVLGAGLAQLPGVVVVGATVIALVGVLPRVAGAACWGLLIAAVLAGPMFGETLRLPPWVQDLSPFTHVPKAPAVPVTAAPVLALVAVGAVLAVAALVSMRRRNLALPA